MTAGVFLTQCRSLTRWRSSGVLTRPSGPGYLIIHWNWRAVTSATGWTLGWAVRNLMLVQVPIWYRAMKTRMADGMIVQTTSSRWLPWKYWAFRPGSWANHQA